MRSRLVALLLTGLYHVWKATVHYAANRITAAPISGGRKMNGHGPRATRLRYPGGAKKKKKT